MQLPFNNVQIKHWNTGAKQPLILPVHMLCNTDDEQLNSNIRINSRRPGKWLEPSEAHNGIAVICGSGPSLADTLDEVFALAQKGAKIFALNGAAKYLADNGLLADYQVMIDARPETADLIGPALTHLFASQVSPVCFDRMPTARVWHLQIEGIDDLLPDDNDTETLLMIGGAASVGNTATCLAYAMGYRAIHCFGYDSSNKGEESHAFRQPMNDGEPCAIVNWRGKTYTSSLTMKLQAEKFQVTARALKELGCTVEVHGYGLLPDIYNAEQSEISEVDKYSLMWDIPEYRIVSPGKESAEMFVSRFRPAYDESVIDFGCGTGLGGLEIAKLSGAYVTLVDFARNCLNNEARGLPFVIADLTQPIGLAGGYGYCCDVMEHIPPSDVDKVIVNIMDCVPDCFFRIDYQDDICGAYIGETLHLSVHDHDWWLRTFTRLGFDLPWFDDQKSHGFFHVKRMN